MSDCLCSCAVFLRAVQIMLGVGLLTAVLVHRTRSAQISYCMPLLAGFFSVLLYMPMITPRAIRQVTPLFVLSGELASCFLWKLALVASSYEFACNQVHSYSTWFVATSLGCSFAGFALSLTALIVLICGPVRQASKTSQWKTQDYFHLGALHTKETSNTSRDFKAPPLDEEWNAGKQETILYHCLGSLDEVYELSPQPTSLSNKDIFASDSEESPTQNYNYDQQRHYSGGESDCLSTSLFDSLEVTSEVSTMKGDNSEIQGIPYADGEHDDGNGDGWRRCGSGANFPRIYEE